MKECPLLLVFTAALSSTAFATNDEEHKVDDLDKLTKEQEYTFSLCASRFNLSNIFSIEPEKFDTLIFEQLSM